MNLYGYWGEKLKKKQNNKKNILESYNEDHSDICDGIKDSWGVIFKQLVLYKTHREEGREI